ncbi:MAG: aromatic amino acid ammonia-lyase [Conexivisphaerales archaeon]
MRVVLNGNSLTIDDAAKVSERKAEVEISQHALNRMQDFRHKLENMLEQKEAIYGVNTGFGLLGKKSIPKNKIRQLQVNLLRSHAAGVGEPFSKDIVRIAMLAKLNSLLNGNSCVRPDVAVLIANMLNSDVIPYVPMLGSLSSSGDLTPSAHMALALLGEGKAYYDGKLIQSGIALSKVGLKPLSLEAKEGLALINGTCFAVALGVKNIVSVRRLLDAANSVTSLTAQAVGASVQSFDDSLMSLRKLKGQTAVAAEILKQIESSSMIRKDAMPQDPYSVRCVPQVHGAVYEALEFASEIVTGELNSVTDNPVMIEGKGILHGGNFHAQPVAMVLDLLSLATSYLGTISLARIHLLMHRSEEMHKFYAENPGLESGLMLAEYTATALQNINSSLVYPSSSFPANVSEGIEDHASFGVNAGLRCLNVAENVSKIISIEMIVASNALYRKGEGGVSQQGKRLLEIIRRISPVVHEDRSISEDVERLSEDVLRGELN